MPIEYLISAYMGVEKFNCLIATREYDLWAFAIVIVRLEGYYSYYENYFLTPALELLEETINKS